MAKTVRFKVRCTICNEIFQNDYVERHTKSKHKDLHECGRCAPTATILEDVQTRQRTMDSFFSSSAGGASTKRRGIDTTESVKTEGSGLPSEEIETGGSIAQSQGKLS